jgi:hypothetical protein
MGDWFPHEERLQETLVKVALAQALGGYLDPCDSGSAWDCTVLVPQRIEMKTDHAAVSTGNLYFEVRNTWQGVASGLATTKADWWAHYVPPPTNTIFLFQPTAMLAFLQQQLLEGTAGYRRTRENGGDNNSQGIVAPIKAIEQQPFVQCLRYALDLRGKLPTLEGAVWRCPECRRTVAIETMVSGMCERCRGHRTF